MTPSLTRRCAAETFSTFVMVFAGTGAMAFDDYGGHITHVGISLTFGLVVMAMIYAVGSVSGAHMNPAATLGFAVAGKFRWREVPSYISAQCLGAMAASVLIYAMCPLKLPHSKFGATEPAVVFLEAGGPTIFVWQSFVMEVILTLILMYTILSVVAAKPEVQSLAGLIIGGVIGLEALFAGPICGASMNPARSLAPAVVSERFEYLWIYLIAPPLGAMLAVPLWKFINAKPSES